MIQLKQITDEHLPQITEWAKREDLAEYFRRFPPFFVWAEPNTMKQYLQNSFLVCDEDLPVGLVQIAGFDAQNRKVELGLLLDGERCKNRAKAAFQSCRQVAEYVFDHLGYNKIFCLALSHRRDIARLLCTFCFKPEGTLRDNVFWRGKFHDESIFGLTKEDFRRII